MQENFLLNADAAIKLYQSVKNLPIIDYHNHLSLLDIAKNKRFFDVYELWIQPDPYKHRAMRMCGVAEKYITGNATSEEKFIKWWETLPKLILNPLSHWSAMELQTVFGITEPLNGQNATKIYQQCNEYLAKNPVTVNSLLELFHVEYACPCSSLIDDIQIYSKIACLSPSLRGDDILLPTQAFLSILAAQTGKEITVLSDYERAIECRLETFAEIGCRFTDHALDNGFTYYKNDGNNAKRFLRWINGTANAEERTRLASYVLMRLGTLYAKHGFVMQVHIGAERYTSSILRKKAGAAKTHVKDDFGFEMIAANKFTTAQIDRATWTEEMLDMLTEWIKTDPRGEKYRDLDWSLEYKLAREGDPDDTQTAL